jgi:hypothetical protein
LESQSTVKLKLKVKVKEISVRQKGNEKKRKGKIDFAKPLSPVISYAKNAMIMYIDDLRLMWI